MGRYDEVRPLANGSISFRLYPHALGPVEALAEMKVQASMAVASGFDGVMISERHGGVAGNVPNPLQVSGWLASEMSQGWIAPCPVLALLRPPALIVEEAAWLSVNYPDRVAIGLGTGGNDLDFRLYHIEKVDLARRFEPVLKFVTEHLLGRSDDDLCRDPAVARCRDHPIPVLSAAMSPAAARRAARCDAGIIGSSLVSLEAERNLSSVYRSAGGTGPDVLIRFVWLGELPAGPVASKFREYQDTSHSSGRSISGVGEIIASTDADVIAQRLIEAMEFTGRTSLHLRVHVPGIPPPEVRDQIQSIGETVLPLVRRALTPSAG